MADAYPAENEVFSGKINTTLLDTWVFDKASDFLRKNKDLLAEKDHAIFFLHLLGLDTGENFVKKNLCVQFGTLKLIFFFVYSWPCS